MTFVTSKKMVSKHVLELLLAGLRERVSSLGIAIAAWDASAQRLGSMDLPCEFCRRMASADCQCLAQMESLARQVMADGKPQVGDGACGGCQIGVPVFQRRRLLGAVVGCFPTREILQRSPLAAFAQRLGLDDASAQGILAEIRHGRNQGADFLALLSWMVEREQNAEVAQNEIQTLSANLANTYEELSLLYRISSLMKVTGPPEDFFKNLCQDLLEVMHVASAAAVVYARPPTEDEDMVIVAGQIDLNQQQIKMLSSAHVAGRCFQNRPMLDNAFATPPESGLGSVVNRVIAAPMVIDKHQMGMVLAFNKGEDFDSVDLKLVHSIANQAGIFLSNHQLYGELQDLLMGVLHALSASIDAKDPYTSGHSERVALLSMMIAEAIGLPQDKVQQLYLTGLLHDIGKIGVPESVLCKPGRLTDEEYATIKRHPSIGANILGGIHQLSSVVTGILTHHERPDGRGYPGGAKGEQVPLEGRIVGLADVFDAMTSDRTYRKALPLSEAMAEIRRNSGTQFDPALVDKFLAMDLPKILEDLRQPARVVFLVRIQELSR